jgi:transcription elongation factor GreA
MRDDVLFVTREGLSRKQQEIDHHVNVKMRENAKAIGRAAEHGDLSENAEYKFALEERDLLRARLAQMNAEVEAAELITPEEVPVEHVGIGTKAIFKRVRDGEPYELSFLGPWEADAEKGRLNYRAPLAQAVLGKRIGDTIEFDHTGAAGTYEIVALENALATEPTDPNAENAAP